MTTYELYQKYRIAEKKCMIVRPNVPKEGHIRPKHVVNIKMYGVSVPRIM
jgi:hypothetical protein